MEHRERVIAALAHEAPDRCPMQVSFTPEFATRLREDMDLGKMDQYQPQGSSNTHELEIALGLDLLLASVGWANSYYQDGDTYVDEWGITFKAVEYTTPFGVGRYTEPVGHPLKDDTAIDSYNAPDPDRPELYSNAARLIDRSRDEYWIVGVTATTIFECAWALRGFQQLLTDLALAPSIAERVLDIPYHYHLAVARRLVQMGVDMIRLGDDVGTQAGMMISPAHWRKFLKPRMASLIAELKAVNPQVKIAYHCDGAIYPIIPELIEIGVDVLNPVQPACMDAALLKKKYGDRLCFWGSIDIQRTLPMGTPAEVEAEVVDRISTLGSNGGLIIGPTHNVQLDTPLENFWAMMRAIEATSYASLEAK